MFDAVKWSFVILGGCLGWVAKEFEPTFPLMIVMVIFILWDAWTAFQLDKRVHKRFPERTKREKAHFTSFAFGKVIKVTIPKRLWLIISGYLIEHWIFIHVQIPLSYILAGAVCFEQLWSVCENESSCRDEENESKFWRVLQRIMIDKTERHFDVSVGEFNQHNEKLDNKDDK